MITMYVYITVSRAHPLIFYTLLDKYRDLCFLISVFNVFEGGLVRLLPRAARPIVDLVCLAVSGLVFLGGWFSFLRYWLDRNKQRHNQRNALKGVKFHDTAQLLRVHPH